MKILNLNKVAAVGNGINWSETAIYDDEHYLVSKCLEY